jgi:hypothetical protein
MSSAERLTIHHRVSQALEVGVRNRDWFLWLDVSGEPELPDLGSLVAETERWLARLDPDAGGDEAELDWVGPGLRVHLRALAKKPRARGGNPLVGNPYPAFAYWVAS